MSYGVAAALQAAVFQRLSGDASLTALVGTAIYDALPTGTLPDLYVILGAEKVQDRSDGTGAGAEHAFMISVVTDSAGFSAAKATAAAISDALVDAPLTLTRGHLVALIKPQFEATKAEADKGRGIIKDPVIHARVVDGLTAAAQGLPGAEVLGVILSPIEGGDGNKEFLIAVKRV